MVPFEFTDRSRDSRNTRIISGLFISFFLSPQSSIFFPSFFRRNENTERKEKRRGNFNRFKEFTTSVRKLTSPTSSSRDLQLHRNRINSIPIEIRLSRISRSISISFRDLHRLRPVLLPHPSRGRDKDGVSTGTNRDTRNATRNARTIGRRVLRFATGSFCSRIGQLFMRGECVDRSSG